jgi:hypothetical protein
LIHWKYLCDPPVFAFFATHLGILKEPPEPRSESVMIRFLHGRYPSMNTGENIIQRRSQRVMLKVSAVVLSQGADDKIISEETRTITVNAHGY